MVSDYQHRLLRTHLHGMFALVFGSGGCGRAACPRDGVHTLWRSDALFSGLAASKGGGNTMALTGSLYCFKANSPKIELSLHIINAALYTSTFANEEAAAAFLYYNGILRKGRAVEWLKKCSPETLPNMRISKATLKRYFIFR